MKYRKRNKNPNRVPLVITYHPNLPKLNQIVKNIKSTNYCNHACMIEPFGTSPRCQSVVVTNHIWQCMRHSCELVNVGVKRTKYAPTLHTKVRQFTYHKYTVIITTQWCGSGLTFFSCLPCTLSDNPWSVDLVCLDVEWLESHGGATTKCRSDGEPALTCRGAICKK